MPYITKQEIDALAEKDTPPATAGQLNFCITTLCLDFLGTAPRYQDYNDVIGALEACKLEFYRRAVAPYEDVKKDSNGDVY